MIQQSYHWAQRKLSVQRIEFTPLQVIVIALALATTFVLRSETLFTFREAATFLGFALLSIVPLGGSLVQILLPDLKSRSARAGLIGITGYAASGTLGFLLGALGVGWLYLPVCVAMLGVWLALLYVQSPTQDRALDRLAAAFPLRQVWNSRSFWILGLIALVSVLVTMPLLAPRISVTDGLLYDYSFRDLQYHLSHAIMFLQGAPLQTWPGLAGTRPLVYPDLHNFWMAQMAVWSGVTIESVFFVYAPLTMILSNTLLLYAFGKRVTGSMWGGCIAAALAYIVFVPNFYEPNFFLRQMETPSWILIRTHFLEFASAPVYGIGWQILTAVALCISFAFSNSTSSTRTGALTIAAILLATLLRVRPQFFVVMVPPFLLVVAWLGYKLRGWWLVVPPAVFALLVGIFIFESTGSYYNTSSLAIGIAYGSMGDFIVESYLTEPLTRWVTSLPQVLAPLVALCLYILIRLVGFAFGLVLTFGIVQGIRKKWRLRAVDWYLVLVLGCTVVACSLIVYPAYVDIGGNWAGQASKIITRIVLLLAVVPLFQLGHAIYRHSAWVRSHSGSLALGALVLFAFISFRGASATLYQQAARAYKLTEQELAAYNWIKVNTSPEMVIAANPAHILNAFGDTVENTYFLTAQTHRPAYVQQEFLASDAQGLEIEKRSRILKELFSTQDPRHLRELLQATNIDLILVYPETPAQTDLSCCTKLLYGKGPQIYQVVHNPP